MTSYFPLRAAQRIGSAVVRILMNPCFLPDWHDTTELANAS